MRIRRMTLVLPSRLRGMAEHEARRIAEEAAARLATEAGGTNLHFEVSGNGLSGHALSAAVGRAVAGKSGAVR